MKNNEHTQLVQNGYFNRMKRERMSQNIINHHAMNEQIELLIQMEVKIQKTMTHAHTHARSGSKHSECKVFYMSSL